jgi:hypothetical protein
MTDFPRSLLEFQRRFPDDAACAAYLAAARWSEGFVCPECGCPRACLLVTKKHTYQCSACHRQTSVTAGTVMHGSKLSLTVWFWAASLMATHSNGISARQLWRQLGLGSYKSAWLLCAKLRSPNRLVAGGRVLPCVRPLVRLAHSRGPVWDSGIKVHTTGTRSKRYPCAWFS